MLLRTHKTSRGALNDRELLTPNPKPQPKSPKENLYIYPSLTQYETMITHNFAGLCDEGEWQTLLEIQKTSRGVPNEKEPDP